MLIAINSDASCNSKFIRKHGHLLKFTNILGLQFPFANIAIFTTHTQRERENVECELFQIQFKFCSLFNYVDLVRISVVSSSFPYSSNFLPRFFDNVICFSICCLSAPFFLTGICLIIIHFLFSSSFFCLKPVFIKFFPDLLNSSFSLLLLLLTSICLIFLSFLSLFPVFLSSFCL